MLVLSRKCGECVQIDGVIEVKVVEVSGGKVKLGISAPADVSIQRHEIRAAYPNHAAWSRPPVAVECCSS